MKTWLTLILGIWLISAAAQNQLKFEILSGNTDRTDCPVSIQLDRFNYNTDSLKLVLSELVGKTEVPLPCQLETGSGARLWFILKGKTPKNTKRTFIVKRIPGQADQQAGISIQEKEGGLQFFSGGKPVLTYQMETVNPPKGVSSLFKRSGFLHPVYSPEGELLTRIQAPDHYHHYGIWNPWTLTFIGKREVDFWNLYKGQGTVRFAGLLSSVQGPVFSGFKSLQQHIDFGARGSDAIAMNELFELRQWNLANNRYMLDYTSILNTPLDSGILLAAYRYGGGIGWRANEKWHKDNCTVLTSEGKTRADADGSNARWCLVEGESISKSGRSGILFMSFPANRMHPEPMRVWPLDANGGRGDMFFEFCPIRHNDWKLEPGNDYTLNYRLVIFDGKMTAEEAENYWQAFANPPAVVIVN